MANWGLIGNEQIVERLQAALANGRLSHAYLLCGPSGIGKTALATALAQTLNCREPEPPCGACSSCRRIAAGGHPDVVTIALESNRTLIGIDRMRELRLSAALKPYEGPWRIFIILEADLLSSDAANTLLKTLEEPPPGVLIVLTTAAEDRVLPTIRSRCQALHLQRVPAPVLTTALVERFALPVPDAEALAALAQGCPGAAIQAAGDPENIEKLEDGLARLRELLEADLPERLIVAGTMVDTGSAGASPAGAGGGRASLQDILARWELWWRDLLLVHQGCPTGLVYTAERENYQRIARGLEVGQVHHALKSIQLARQQLEQNALPRLVLDVLSLEFPTIIKL